MKFSVQHFSNDVRIFKRSANKILNLQINIVFFNTSDNEIMPEYHPYKLLFWC